jgi:DNA-binding response OmpR family regulator
MLSASSWTLFFELGSGFAKQRFAMSQHILVVDDEAQIRELLCVYLIKQGFEVSSAATSQETLRILQEKQIDLVVLDIGLADEDGLRLLADIKKNQPALRVVMLTGMGFVEDLLQEAHQKGADGYVSKVLPLDELLMAIQRTFKPGSTQLQGAA